MKIFIFSVIVMSFLTSTLMLAANPQEASSPLKTVLTNCNVIDCTGKEPMKNMTVVIIGNSIAEIRQGPYRKSAGEKNVRLLNLKNGYVLPYFWNVHMHLANLLPDPNHIRDNESLSSAVMRAGLKAMDGLRHGFIGVRTTGEREYLDVALRDIFDHGFFMGPCIGGGIQQRECGMATS